MPLSRELISQFAKITKEDKKTDSEKTVYGTIVEFEGEKYVKLDGSDLLTPVESTTNIENEERVTVLIKNHTATVTGNITSPSARSVEVKTVSTAVGEFDRLLANKAEISDLEAVNAKIDNLDVGDLTAVNAEIENLKANKASIEQLEAVDAKIENLDVGDLTAVNAEIENLKANKADIEDLKTTYASIDFANIGEAAIKKLYADTGLVKDLVVSEGRITGELDAVRINADMIASGTLKTDRLLIKGESGLYYALNVGEDGIPDASIAPEEYQNGLHGSKIIAESITANKIAVDDLVAFDATIGGFVISNSAIHSAAKSLISSTIAGVYLGKDGQVNIGDGSHYLKFYKDSSNKWKLAIAADTITYGSSNQSVEAAIKSVNDAVSEITDDYIVDTVTSSTKYTDLEKTVTETKAAVSKITDSYIIDKVTSSTKYTGLEKTVTENKAAVSKITDSYIVDTVTSSTEYTGLKDVVDGKANPTYTQYRQPSNPKKGDIWIGSGEDNTWSALASITWGDVNDKLWGEHHNPFPKTRVYDGSKWQLASDLKANAEMQTKIEQTAGKIESLATKTELGVVQSAVEKITPEYITNTVVNGKDFTEVKQTSDRIALQVDNGELDNGTVQIDKGGVKLSGGSIDLKANSNINVESGGLVKISAEKDESYISFGESFSASGDGLTATDGKFMSSLSVGGKAVLTEGMLPAKIVVSPTQPPGTGIIWLVPSTANNVSYSGYTSDARDSTVLLANTISKTLPISCQTSDTMSGGTYSYKVKVPVYLTGDGSKETNVVISIVAKKGSTTVTFPSVTIPSLKGWSLYEVESTVSNTATNLCADTSNINITVTATNVASHNLFIQSQSYIDLTATDVNASGTVQACSVYYIS